MRRKQMTIDYSTLKNANISELRKLRDVIDSYFAACRDSRYVEVTILNRSGNVTKDIKKKFPDFSVRWHAENPGTIGENIVLIPKALWNDEVKAEISKFDDFVGHHVEKHDAYIIREDVDLPHELKQVVDYRRSIVESSGKKIDKVVISAWEFKNNYPFRNYLGRKDKYFIKTEIIDREWDDLLWVNDFTNEDHFSQFKNFKIEL